MAPHDQDSQVKFLVACIKNCSSPGKVDFAAVAKELGIVSKGAAAKRYERLMRAHGIPSGSASRSSGSRGSSTPTPAGRSAGGGSGKKRKLEMGATDDVEDAVKTKLFKSEGPVKKEEVADDRGASVADQLVVSLDDTFGGGATAAPAPAAAGPPEAAPAAPVYDYHTSYGFQPHNSPATHHHHPAVQLAMGGMGGGDWLHAAVSSSDHDNSAAHHCWNGLFLSKGQEGEEGV